MNNHKTDRELLESIDSKVSVVFGFIIGLLIGVVIFAIGTAIIKHI